MSKDKPPQKEEKDFWDGCAGFGKGLWNSVESAATGIWDMVSSPVETATGIFNAVIHPVDTYNNIADSLEEYWEENWTNGDAETRSMVVGNIIGEVAIGLLGTKGADKLSKSLKVIKAGKAKTGAKAMKIKSGKPIKRERKLNRKSSPESGNKTVNVNEKNVTMDNGTFDPNFTDTRGRTNIQRMEQGLAPIGKDGKSVNIHHIDQTNNGPVKEILASEHQHNYKALHKNTGQAPTKINRKEFNKWRRDYWKWRSKNLE